MATVKLVIRKDKINAAGETPIFVLYTYNGNSVKFSTGEKINPNDWEPKTGQVKRSYGRGYVTLNDTLKVKVDEVEQIKRLAIQQKIEPTTEYVKSQYALKDKPKLPEQNKDFYILFENFIKETSSLKAHGTVKHYKSTLNHLRNFATKKRIKLTLDTLTIDVYNRFVNFLLTDMDMTNGTANNQIKRLKVFLGYLFDKAIHTNADYQKFKLLKNTETDIIYLTKEELDKLYLFDLSDNSRLERVRDMLVLACSTGLRHSDFSSIRAENIKGDYLLVRTQKTKDSLRIPLNSYSTAILQKYSGKLPALSQQKFNEYVKELGKMCGIDEPTEIIKYTGSKRVEKRVPKYELLSSHTGRRTFVTQSLERGMNAQEIMAITGHKDIKTMMKYVKITDTVKQVAMSRAWSDAPSQLKVS